MGEREERSVVLITRSSHRLADQYGSRRLATSLQYVCSICEGNRQRLSLRIVIANPMAKCAKKAFSQVLIPDSTHLHPPQRSHKTTSLAFASCTFQLRDCPARDKNCRTCYANKCTVWEARHFCLPLCPRQETPSRNSPGKWPQYLYQSLPEMLLEGQVCTLLRIWQQALGILSAVFPEVRQDAADCTAYDLQPARLC